MSVKSNQNKKSEGQGTIRSKTFIKNFFVGRGYFFNPEVTIIQTSPPHQEQVKENSFFQRKAPFYFAPQTKNSPSPRSLSAKHHSLIKSKKLQNSVKTLSFKVDTPQNKTSNISMENEFEVLLQVIEI